MSLLKRSPMITFEAPQIRFTADGKLLAKAQLSELRRFLVVECFVPEVAPDPEPVLFDLLDFGDTFWLVPDCSSERFLYAEWVPHFQTCQGYFHAKETDALPLPWRRSYLLAFKNLYRPKAAVLPAQETPFMKLVGPFDPARILEMDKYSYGLLMNDWVDLRPKG
jgi:hypothetical protein